MAVNESRTRGPRWRRWLLSGAGLIVVALSFLVWYTHHYAMGAAQPRDLPGSPAAPRVLIATQGSAFKDALTAGLIDRLQQRSVSVKVIDVSALAGVQEGDWDAMVVIHTWEMRKPPAAVKSFAERTSDRGKLIVLTTSGAGHFRLEGVDAISAASKLDQVGARVSELAGRIDAILDAGAESERGAP